MSFGLQKRKDPHLVRTQSLAAGTGLGTAVAIGGGIFLLGAMIGHPVVGFFAAALGSFFYVPFSSIFGWYYAKDKVERDVAREAAIERAKAAARDASNASVEAWRVARATDEQARSIQANATASKEACRRAAQAALDAERAANAAGEHASAANEAVIAAEQGTGDYAATNSALDAARATKAAAEEVNRQYAIAGQAAMQAQQAVAEEGEDRTFILKRLNHTNNFIGFLESSADQNRRDEVKQSASGQLLDIVIRLKDPNVVTLLRTDSAIRGLLIAVNDRLDKYQVDIPHMAIILDIAGLPHR